MTFELIQILYWLALSTWFGGALFIAVASRVIQNTLHESDPILPDVLSVNLEGQHGTLLAGAIVGNILSAFTAIEYICGGALAICLIYLAVIDWDDSLVRTANILRCLLLVSATGVVVFDRRVLWPSIWKYRQEFIDHADEPEVANPAKDRFDHYQAQSLIALQVLLFLLLGLVLFSGSIQKTVVRGPVEAPAPHLTTKDVE